MLDLMIGQMMG